MIFAADLAGTGVTVNTLLPGGACDTGSSETRGGAPPHPATRHNATSARLT